VQLHNNDSFQGNVPPTCGHSAIAGPLGCSREELILSSWSFVACSISRKTVARATRAVYGAEGRKVRRK